MHKKLSPYQNMILKMIKDRKSGKKADPEEYTEDYRNLPDENLGNADESNGIAESCDGDYLALVDQYQKKHQCSKLDAFRAIDKLVPSAREKFIADANPEPEDPLYSGELDPKDYMKIIRQYRRDYKCGRIEAMRMIDEDHPGLRETYIKKVNEG
jgi:hypothetical protein